jgi:hypothetical protein
MSNRPQEEAAEIREARRLRMKGATDKDLKNLGYNQTVINRSYITPDMKKCKRCPCGAYAILNILGHCKACETRRAIK